MGNTEELKDKVNEAYEAVAGLSDDTYKLEGFKIVLTSLIGQPKAAAGAVRAPSGADAVDGAQPTDWQSAIATRLGLQVADVARLYHLDNEGELRLILDTKVLPKKSLALATQHIAALICAGRQAAKFDEGQTSFDVIRKECVEYGVLNKSNFTGYLKKMKPRFLVEGKGMSQSMRVTAPGYDDAAETAKKYLGQDR